nr:unnamed protein product [Callosobruchus analis]
MVSLVFSKANLAEAAHHIKTGKAPGPDHIPPEALTVRMIPSPSSVFRPNCMIRMVGKLHERKNVCLLTAACLFLALIIYFITAFIFQGSDIYETYCIVIPSISAITGISPQRYLWRISIAFYIGPRFIISAVSRAYHMNLINEEAPTELRAKARLCLSLAFWANMIETGALCGVTYISNRDLSWQGYEKEENQLLMLLEGND